MIGTNAAEARMSENSYLLIAARSGIIGMIPFLGAMVSIIMGVVKLQRVRRYLSDDIFLPDLVTAGIVSLALGGMFEGYLFGTYNFPVFCAVPLRDAADVPSGLLAQEAA